jgi:hypothetical protein
VGFIHLWGLPVKTQAQIQLLADAEGPLSIMAPKGAPATKDPDTPKEDRE